MPDPSRGVADTLAVLDWRRRIHDLYRQVRELADPKAAHAAWIMGRDRLFAEHAASPLLPEHRVQFTGLDVAPYDPRYRFEAVVEPADAGPGTFRAPTGTDGEVPYQRLGRVRLPAPGGEVLLDVWRLASYGGGLFLPIRDGTCGVGNHSAGNHSAGNHGAGSYGGGRYVLDTVKGADLGQGREPFTLLVDLNFSYSPSCAYDPRWACPLAPAGNTTAVPLAVGERHRGPWAL